MTTHTLVPAAAVVKSSSVAYYIIVACIALFIALAAYIFIINFNIKRKR